MLKINEEDKPSNSMKSFEGCWAHFNDCMSFVSRLQTSFPYKYLNLEDNIFLKINVKFATQPITLKQ